MKNPRNGLPREEKFIRGNGPGNLRPFPDGSNTHPRQIPSSSLSRSACCSTTEQRFSPRCSPVCGSLRERETSTAPLTSTRRAGVSIQVQPNSTVPNLNHGVGIKAPQRHSAVTGPAPEPVQNLSILKHRGLHIGIDVVRLRGSSRLAVPGACASQTISLQHHRHSGGRPLEKFRDNERPLESHWIGVH